MDDQAPKPIATPEEHRRAAEAVLPELRRILRFESDHAVHESLRLAALLERRPVPQARRTALISDIHGNHAGLLAVLADIERQRCDRIVCLGDLVEGGPANDEVVETLARLAVPCVRGNHDEFNDVELSAQTRAILDGLPERIVEDDVLYVHISPRPIKRKVNHAVEAWNVFQESRFRLTFIGHVHVPYIFGEQSGTYGEARLHAFEYGRPFPFEAGDRYIVSIGSVGYGRDNVGRIRYAIFDREANSVELRAIDGPLLPLDNALRSMNP